jgi:sortase A
MRRAVSAFLIAAGLVLCGLAARHYVRGWLAQAEGRRELARKAAAPPGNPRVSPEAPAPPSPLPSLGAASEDAVAPVSGGLPAGYPYGQPIARLTIPAARIDAVVFGGADADTLEKGPGHVPGTELPGSHTSRNNCVITGHRDSHFRHLGWLRPGHEIDLETSGVSERFRVVSREIVAPDTVRVLAASDRPRLTLITCYPFNFVGPAPSRLVVVAEPVDRALPGKHPASTSLGGALSFGVAASFGVAPS